MRAVSLNPVVLPPLEIQAGETCLRHYCAIIVLLTIFDGIGMIFNLAFLFISRA